jgi:hypothetical protein
VTSNNKLFADIYRCPVGTSDNTTVTLSSKNIISVFTPSSLIPDGYSVSQASDSCAFAYGYCIFHDSYFDIFLYVSEVTWFYK